MRSWTWPSSSSTWPGITWFGARFRRSQRTLKDYFLGGRTAPWWAIALSIVSAETSTLTIIGTPALAFDGNFGFLQVVFGYLLARLVISALFLPHYFRGEMYTAYELIGSRFGPARGRLTAGTFLVLRALAEGVRVFAISIVISIVLGTGELASIVLIVCLTLFYTFEGGMTAVIWTDVVQMFLYVAGALVSFCVILQHIPGGWDQVWSLAGAAGKFQVFDFRFALTPRVLLAHLLVLGGRDRRMLPDHGQPRHRAADGAAPAGRAHPAREPRRAVRKLGRDLCSVQPVPADRRDPVRVLHHDRPGGAATGGPHLPGLRLALPADGSRRPGDRRHPGGGHVEPERGAELAGLDHHHGFLQAAGDERGVCSIPKRTSSGWPAWRPWSGASCCSESATWRGHGARCWKPASRSRPSSTVRCWACSCSGSLTRRVGENAAIAGMVAGLAVMAARQALHLHRLDLVRGDRHVGDVPGRICGVVRRKRGEWMAEPRGLKRVLGPWSAASIVVGTIIGSGIFLVPKAMMQQVGSVEMVFVVWIVGGLLSLFGALSYAELGAALAGGRRRIRLPARGLRPGVGIPVRLDANLGGEERIDRHDGHGFLLLPRQFPAGTRRRTLRNSPSDRSRRRAAGDSLRPIAGRGA